MSDSECRRRTVQFDPGAIKMSSCYIDPGAFVAEMFVAELADAWKECSETGAYAPGFVVSRSSAIRSVGNYLTEDSDRFLTMLGNGTQVVERLHDWELAMVEKFPPPSTRAKTLGGMVRHQISYFLQAQGIDGGPLADWASAQVLDGRPHESVPLDEFSNDERLQLERACREIVRATEARLAHGDALLEMGRDPRRYGWDSVENVLWALRHLPYEKSFRAFLLSGSGQLDAHEVDRLSGIRRLEGRTKAPFIVESVGAFLVPDADYLIAARVLLHLKTGWSPEESRTLRRNDLVFEPDQIRVRATKLRAQRIRWHTLTSSDDHQWGWKAGDLLRRTRHALRHAHALTPDEPMFWVSGFRSYPGCAEHEYPQFVVRPNRFDGNNSLGGFIERNALDITRPHDMRRLRKTVKSARAILLGTLSGAAGDDQTVEVFRGHYAQTTTVHTIAAQTVLRAQEKVLARASEGPTLVAASAADMEAIGTDPEINELAAEVAGESPTEQELTLAACRDPYDAPFAERGSLCHASPSMCLQCRNAVVFRDHLPRLLTYQGVLDEVEKVMPPTVFSEVYGQQKVNIAAIVEEFPAEWISTARQADARLHRPLGQRAEL